MFYSFVQDKIWKLVTCNTPSTTKRRNVIDSEKQSGLFWPTLYIYTSLFAKESHSVGDNLFFFLYFCTFLCLRSWGLGACPQKKKSILR